MLNWATASEDNNLEFRVQRSSDLVAWETVGTVAGAGTIRQYRTYNYTDAAPNASQRFYRLLQVDLDGTLNAGPVVEVGITPEPYVLSPNPVSSGDRVQITIVDPQFDPRSTHNLRVTSLQGQALLVRNGTLGQVVDALNQQTPNLPSGIYMVTLTGNQTQQTFRLLRQ